MKTLEELGISPIPWRISEDWSCIKDGSENPVTVCELPFPGLQYKHKVENARMLKAAPDMYEALREALKAFGSEAEEVQWSAILAAEAALKKAGGEESSHEGAR